MHFPTLPILGATVFFQTEKS